MRDAKKATTTMTTTTTTRADIFFYDFLLKEKNLLIPAAAGYFPSMQSLILWPLAGACGRGDCSSLHSAFVVCCMLRRIYKKKSSEATQGRAWSVCVSPVWVAPFVLVWVAPCLLCGSRPLSLCGSPSLCAGALCVGALCVGRSLVGPSPPVFDPRHADIRMRDGSRICACSHG